MSSPPWAMSSSASSCPRSHRIRASTTSGVSASKVGWGGPRFTDHEAARREGFPGALVPGVMSQGFLGAMIHRWAPAAEIVAIDTVFRAPVLADKPHSIAGVVTDIDEEAGTVEIDITVANETQETRRIRNSDRSPADRNRFRRDRTSMQTPPLSATGGRNIGCLRAHFYAALACAAAMACASCAPKAEPSAEDVSLNDRGVALMGRYEYATAEETFSEVVDRAPPMARRPGQLGHSHPEPAAGGRRAARARHP